MVTEDEKKNETINKLTNLTWQRRNRPPKARNKNENLLKPILGNDPEIQNEKQADDTAQPKYIKQSPKVERKTAKKDDKTNKPRHGLNKRYLSTKWNQNSVQNLDNNIENHDVFACDSINFSSQPETSIQNFSFNQVDHSMNQYSPIKPFFYSNESPIQTRAEYEAPTFDFIPNSTNISDSNIYEVAKSIASIPSNDLSNFMNMNNFAPSYTTLSPTMWNNFGNQMLQNSSPIEPNFGFDYPSRSFGPDNVNKTEYPNTFADVQSPNFVQSQRNDRSFTFNDITFQLPSQNKPDSMNFNQNANFESLNFNNQQICNILKIASLNESSDNVSPVVNSDLNERKKAVTVANSSSSMINDHRIERTTKCVNIMKNYQKRAADSAKINSNIVNVAQQLYNVSNYVNTPDTDKKDAVGQFNLALFNKHESKKYEMPEKENVTLIYGSPNSLTIEVNDDCLFNFDQKASEEDEYPNLPIVLKDAPAIGILKKKPKIKMNISSEGAIQFQKKLPNQDSPNISSPSSKSSISKKVSFSPEIVHFIV